jgi:hypothetical protein
MIARVIASQGGQATSEDPVFLQTCVDVLGPACLDILTAHGLLSKELQLSLSRDEGAIALGARNGALVQGV